MQSLLNACLLPFPSNPPPLISLLSGETELIVGVFTFEALTSPGASFSGVFLAIASLIRRALASS